jgi:VanZ family protein
VQPEIAFAILAFLVTGVGIMRGIPSNMLFLGVIRLLAICGIVDEATQALVLYRQPSLLDWWADLVGITVGCGALMLAGRLVACCRLAAAGQLIRLKLCRLKTASQ